MFSSICLIKSQSSLRGYLASLTSAGRDGNTRAKEIFMRIFVPRATKASLTVSMAKIFQLFQAILVFLTIDVSQTLKLWKFSRSANPANFQGAETSKIAQMPLNYSLRSTKFSKIHKIPYNFAISSHFAIYLAMCACTSQTSRDVRSKLRTPRWILRNFDLLAKEEDCPRRTRRQRNAEIIPQNCQD